MAGTPYCLTLRLANSKIAIPTTFPTTITPQIFAVNCAHLGCPVEWFPQSGLFMCPCHGGVYYANGERASGPPTRGLFQCDWRERDGKLELKAPHYPTLQDTERRPS